jgi:AcrR family transcriptional regulator
MRWEPLQGVDSRVGIGMLGVRVSEGDKKLAKRRTVSPPTPKAPALSRERIVVTALDLIDDEGLDALTMRKLAARLKVSGQALYWHFQNKDALCRAVVELVRSDVHIDVDEALPPSDRVRALMAGLREHYATHPCAIELGRRYMPSTAGHIVELGVRTMRAVGFDNPEIALGQYRALMWTVMGFAILEHGAHSSIHHTPLDASTYEVRLRTAADDEGAEISHRVNIDELFADLVEVFVEGLQRVATTRA